MEVPAMRALQGYAHVMMAKPGVDSLAAFDRVLRVADYAQRSVTVDYTMLMHATWNTILHEQHRLGGIEKFHSVRSAIGNRTGAPIVLDMLVHDLSLLVSLNPDREWLLEYARVSETEVVARFVSGECEAILEASTTSTEQERSVYLAGAGLHLVWDQLADVVESNSAEIMQAWYDDEKIPCTPVQRRLNNMVNVVNHRGDDNRVVARGVLVMVEQILEAQR
jgi:predicted dehydrogenase